MCPTSSILLVLFSFWVILFGKRGKEGSKDGKQREKYSAPAAFHLAPQLLATSRSSCLTAAHPSLGSARHRPRFRSQHPTSGAPRPTAISPILATTAASLLLQPRPDSPLLDPTSAPPPSVCSTSSTTVLPTLSWSVSSLYPVSLSLSIHPSPASSMTMLIRDGIP